MKKYMNRNRCAGESLGAILFGIIILVVIGFVVTFIFMGPKGCEAEWEQYKASGYGSDWLVVQYAQDGSVITYWELDNKAIQNEPSSDGIFFVTGDQVIHLSGHYIYVQNPNDEVKTHLLRNGKSNR